MIMFEQKATKKEDFNKNDSNCSKIGLNIYVPKSHKGPFINNIGNFFRFLTPLSPIPHVGHFLVLSVWNLDQFLPPSPSHGDQENMSMQVLNNSRANSKCSENGLIARDGSKFLLLSLNWNPCSQPMSGFDSSVLSKG